MTCAACIPFCGSELRHRLCKCSDARTIAHCKATHIIEAIELIRSEMAGVTLEAFEPDRRKRWLVERGVEIISEASRHLGDELKARYPGIPWPKVAGIGNVLRHEYEHVAHDAPPAARA